MKKMKLETAFIKYGKYKMVNFIRAEITDKINHRMTTNKILYTLDSYDLLKPTEKRLHQLKSDVNGRLYLYNNYKFPFTFV